MNTFLKNPACFLGANEPARIFVLAVGEEQQYRNLLTHSARLQSARQRKNAWAFFRFRMLTSRGDATDFASDRSLPSRKRSRAELPTPSAN